MKQFESVRAHLTTLAIAILGVVLSVFGYIFTSELEAQREQLLITKLLGEKLSQLETRITVTVEILDSLASYISNAETVSPESYAAFTRPMLSRHPEFWALHWAPYIKHEQREQFEKELSERGFYKGITELEPESNTITESSFQVDYYPVMLTEPLGKNYKIVGFNANSRKINSYVIEKLLSENINFQSSAPFQLIQDNEGSASVLFFRPVFSTNLSPKDPNIRKSKISGFIIALVKPQTILDNLVVDNDEFSLLLNDISDTKITQIGQSGLPINNLEHTRTANFTSLGREWQMVLSVSKDYLAMHSGFNYALWILSGGVSFTLILSIILLRLSKAHSQILRERDKAHSYLDTVETIVMALDSHGRVKMINRKGCEVLGYTQSELANDVWFSHKFVENPNDLYEKFIGSMRDGSLTNGLGYSENPVFDSSRNKLLIAWHNRIQFDSNGEPSGMLCAGEDITQKYYFQVLDNIRSEAMHSYLEGMELKKVLDKVIIGIESINPGAKCSILLLDESGKHLLSGSAPSLPESYNQAIDGIEIGDGVGSCGTAAYRQERVIVEDIQTHAYWASFKELAAHYHLGSCWSEPIFGKKDRILGTFAIYHQKVCSPSYQNLDLISNISKFVSLLIEGQLAEEDLKRMATVDELTSLPNRRKFLSVLETELTRAKRYDRELSLCMVDLDFFKKINDQYGHSAGDCVLRDIAQVMESMLRETDLVGRLGGEEFAILLPDTNEANAMIMAERLRVAIEQKQITHQEDRLIVTASIGLCSLKSNSEGIKASDLLSESDRCLYFAKQNGRNQVSNTPIELNAKS